MTAGDYSFLARRHFIGALSAGVAAVLTEPGELQERSAPLDER